MHINTYTMNVHELPCLRMNEDGTEKQTGTICVEVYCGKMYDPRHGERLFMRDIGILNAWTIDRIVEPSCVEISHGAWKVFVPIVFIEELRKNHGLTQLCKFWEFE